MAIDSGVMANAFEVGAGFSADSLSLFMVSLLAIMALVWSLILLIGWHQGAQRASMFSQYMVMRLMGLGFLLTLLLAMLGTST